jgi:hypothetical protein
MAWSRVILAGSLLIFASIALSLLCTASAQSSTPIQTPIVADRVLVVVNQQVILQSDLDREIRLSILDPNLDFAHHPEPAVALEHLISRALIRQQFANQPLLTTAELQQAVDDHIQELHTQLPACVRLNCVKPEGWQAFLAESHLTAAEVDAFLREQIQILDCIEKRFQAGIHITPEQVADYYRTSLLPQYTKTAQVPTLESVASRITEILLERQVNLLLESWLTTLRKEGEVVFLDPSLVSEPALEPSQKDVIPVTQPVSSVSQNPASVNQTSTPAAAPIATTGGPRP